MAVLQWRWLCTERLALEWAERAEVCNPIHFVLLCGESYEVYDLSEDEWVG